MRNFLKLTAVILIFASSGNILANGSNAKTDVETIKNNYIAGLNHQVAGVVESAIKNVINMKVHFPEYDYTSVIEKLEELTIAGVTKTIRLKAMIANDYLKNFDDYKELQNSEYENGDEVFNLYFNQVSQTISSTNF